RSLVLRGPPASHGPRDRARLGRRRAVGPAPRPVPGTPRGDARRERVAGWRACCRAATVRRVEPVPERGSVWAMNTAVGSRSGGRGVSRGGVAARSEADAGYARLMHMREPVEHGRWGMWVDFTGREQIHFFVRWDEWPALKSIR